ncbi:hypothetical protein SAMN05216215_1011156 [Saccharopolyspora shandongensis]|uniref:Uncharacterized protein n=1 Tax=Saccharopolyspora shandongensis TaxID=418495 RepID=A0A1H3C287_9PSEU|nr:hypothetical protein [Saccharopolyspora shandongensis]SDX48165.1 hypothetical protein SAMN05216215_1011156 [Saccharopolyspora shandongensis]
MLWLQLSTFVLFNLLILAMLTTRIPLRGLRFAAGQHAGGGERDYTVWRLIADVEAENAEARGAGRRRATDRELREIPTEFPETDPDRPTPCPAGTAPGSVGVMGRGRLAGWGFAVTVCGGDGRRG